MSFPDCSIAGLRPILEPKSYDIVEQEIKRRSKFLPTLGKGVAYAALYLLNRGFGKSGTIF
jgi:hypothetical protein